MRHPKTIASEDCRGIVGVFGSKEASAGASREQSYARRDALRAILIPPCAERKERHRKPHLSIGPNEEEGT